MVLVRSGKERIDDTSPHLDLHSLWRNIPCCPCIQPLLLSNTFISRQSASWQTLSPPGLQPGSTFKQTKNLLFACLMLLFSTQPTYSQVTSWQFPSKWRTRSLFVVLEDSGKFFSLPEPANMSNRFFFASFNYFLNYKAWVPAENTFRLSQWINHLLPWSYLTLGLSIHLFVPWHLDNHCPCLTS